MTGENFYAPALRSALLMLSTIPDEEIDKGIETMQRFVDVGYILDPTRWRNEHEKVMKDVEMMKAIRKVKQLIKQGTMT